MNLAVFGATGLTGAEVVAQALAAGHRVVVLVRSAARVTTVHPALTVLEGSPNDLADVRRCLQGAEVVIHCLGIGGKGDGRPSSVVSDSVALVVNTMADAGVRRIVCMSNVGAGGSGAWVVRNVVIPIFLRWLQPILEDKERMEAILAASAVEWVSVRLVGIVEGPEKPVRVTADGAGLRPTITAASTAAFLLARASGPEFLRETPALSN